MNKISKGGLCKAGRPFFCVVSVKTIRTRLLNGGMKIATTWIKSLHGSKRQSVERTLRERINYAINPNKTEDGQLVSSYECEPETVAEDFAVSKTIYSIQTGRERFPSEDVIAYNIRQSFKPGEVTPEQANQIGYDLAMEFTKGQHQFIVATHTDKAHIHNHVIFNSVTLDCDRKFANPHQCSRDVAKISDRLCREHGLSVIETPKQKGKSYKEWDARRKGESWKGKLQETIDRVLPDSRDFDDFLSRMREEGYEIKLNRNLSFRAVGQERFTRSKTLGTEYTLDALKERLNPIRRKPDAVKGEYPSAGKSVGKKVNPLIDIQAKLQAGKGIGFAKWASVYNLKEASKTLNFLLEQGVSDYEELEMRIVKTEEKFDTASARIKQLEARLVELSSLRTHIINYSKTRDVYDAYRRSKQKKKYFAEHEEELKEHVTAKKAFDALGGAKIPKVSEIQAEFSSLLAEKKEQYEIYKTAKKDMIAYRTAKQNLDRLLHTQPSREQCRESER